MKWGLHDDEVRALLTVVLAALVGLLPFLIGQLDVPTTVVVAAIGSVTVLPSWRYVGEPPTTPMALIALLTFVVGPLVVAGLFSGPAAVTSSARGWARWECCDS